MGYALSPAPSFFVTLLISQSFPFSEDLSVCFWFVSTAGPVVTRGPFDVHMVDLSGILPLQTPKVNALGLAIPLNSALTVPILLFIPSAPCILL